MIDDSFDEGPEVYIFNYGKHDGEEITEVPNTYLEWTVENIEKKYIVEACEAELKRRQRKGIYIEDDYESGDFSGRY